MSKFYDITKKYNVNPDLFKDMIEGNSPDSIDNWISKHKILNHVAYRNAWNEFYGYSPRYPIRTVTCYIFRDIMASDILSEAEKDELHNYIFDVCGAKNGGVVNLWFDDNVPNGVVKLFEKLKPGSEVYMDNILLYVWWLEWEGSRRPKLGVYEALPQKDKK